jgi:regulator of cell morphogenesis and NO signaling
MYQPPHLTSEVMAFSKEHEKTMQHTEELKQLLGLLQNITAPLEQSQKILQLLEMELKFNQELEPHYYNEEKALFPILGKHIGFESGIIPDVINEHEQLRALFEKFKRAITQLQNSWTNDHVEQLSGAGEKFVSFMSEHIDKEDEELFPLIENQLSLEEKREVFYKLYANIKPKE